MAKNKRTSRNKYRSVKQDIVRYSTMRYTDNRFGKRIMIRLGEAIDRRIVGRDMRIEKTGLVLRRAAHIAIEREKQGKRQARAALA